MYLNKENKKWAIFFIFEINFDETLSAATSLSFIGE